MWHPVTLALTFAMWHPSGATDTTWHAVDEQMVICPTMTGPGTRTPRTLAGQRPVEKGCSIQVPLTAESGMNLSIPHRVIFSRQGKKEKVSITYSVTDADEKVVIPSKTVELWGDAEEDGKATPRQLKKDDKMPEYLKGKTNKQEGSHEKGKSSGIDSDKEALTPAALAQLIVTFDVNKDGKVDMKDGEGGGGGGGEKLETHKEKECDGTAYTNEKHGKKNGCNGWFGITAKECERKCATNAKAPFCPKKECYAGVFFPAATKHNKDGGWCHLYVKDECKKIKENWGHPVTFSKVTERRLGGEGATDGEGADTSTGDDAAAARQLDSDDVASSLAAVIDHFDTNGDGQIDLQDAKKDGSDDWKKFAGKFAGKFGGEAASASFETIKEKVCKGKAYTNVDHGKKNGCNGIVGIDKDECREKCATNAKVPFCPHEKCAASVFFPAKKGKGWCHLYTEEECEKTEEDWGHPITFKKSTVRRLEADAAGRKVVEGRGADAGCEDADLCNDEIGIEFIPNTYASPITINIEAIRGEEYLEEDICPKNDLNMPKENNAVKTSDRQRSLFVTLKEIRDLATPPSGAAATQSYFV